MGGREDWERRVGRRSHRSLRADHKLPPPDRLRAASGAGQVTLRWEPVDEAIGYLVHRSDSADGPFEPVDHGGRDVLAVPGPVYCDTTGQPGHHYWYAVGSIPSVEAGPGELSEPVEAAPTAGPAEPLDVVVDLQTSAALEPIWHMVGAERLSQLLIEERTGGRPIAEEVAEALRLAREELGADRVRAHAILHDDLGVYREEGGEPRFDFERIDRIYDRVLDLGLLPVVELSFMPRGLASDPDATVFEYGAIISPPRDWDRWAQLCGRLAAHLVDRYGIERVARFGFEVWNEANLEVFWSGSQADYFRLYETAARAVKAVDGRLLVGGPASAAAGWIADFLDFVRAAHAPLDFLSTHTYGNLPLDVGRALAARGLDGVEVWWTEWGVTPTHFNETTDGVFGAPFVLHGMKSVQGRADALAYWVVSDHFEELGRPPRLFHGGFGLLTVGNLRKPRWWALALAEQLGRDGVAVELGGDGAGSLVEAWAARHEERTIDVLLWNGTLAQSKAAGSQFLSRRVRIRVKGQDVRSCDAAIARVDEEHSNIARAWHGKSDWPSEAEWEALRRSDRLAEEPVEVTDSGEIWLDLPMPGIARVRLSASEAGTALRSML